jgi:hypothetical protein
MISRHAAWSALQTPGLLLQPSPETLFVCSLLICKTSPHNNLLQAILPWKLHLLLIFKDLEKACIHYFFNQRAPNSQLECN